MNFRQKLAYTATGAAFMLVGMLTANHLTPINAENDTFGDIICTGLTVIDKHSPAKVHIYADRHGATLQLTAGQSEQQRIKLTCSESDEHARISVSGGRDGNHAIDIFTESRGNVKNPDNPEDASFGIAIYNLNKSRISRAGMMVRGSGEGSFFANGVDDKPLWDSPTSYNQ
ncbi:MAG: hypothetical protein OXN17_19095 [Candidatus Poribacteria bacterium]|nr:hypothetical protein [Candidatus Poribacteria bacterium]MDE0506650.1 hypothetical protein [Candidatus Poribacteria bacterium]